MFKKKRNSGAILMNIIEGGTDNGAINSTNYNNNPLGTGKKR
jgi:hypothetical protein